MRILGQNRDMITPIGSYLKAMNSLAKQFSQTNYADKNLHRQYLKDIDVPFLWQTHLKSLLPPCLFYLNDGVGEKGGPGSIQERNSYNQTVFGKGIAPAGDLMSSLPAEWRAENLMCYIGHEGTYTPAHREMCASLGHNIMVENSHIQNGERAGRSIWFMTETKDRELVSEYFLSKLGHDIEIEAHFASANAWRKAPFAVHVVEQKKGDLILIPPLAPHQVWNCGTRTIKVAWNRTTADTLRLALHEAIPRARMVCRDEQYKNKAIVYFTLKKYYDLIERVEALEATAMYPIRKTARVKQLLRDFRKLFALYTEVLLSESFAGMVPDERNIETLPFQSNVACSYCRCNIFNRFLTCKTCIVPGPNGEEDAYDVCMECFAMGRSCACISRFKWVEQWDWNELTDNHAKWRQAIIRTDGQEDAESPPSLAEALRQWNKKSVAQVCQEEMKLRPWNNVKVNPNPTHSQDSGNHLKRRSTSPEAGESAENPAEPDRTHTFCHMCRHKHLNWKLAFCRNCPAAYCYGTLWRAFDLTPQAVMEEWNWHCPRCSKICSCTKCKRNPSFTPYRPKGTLLGYDTRKVADPRSVESLVDFRYANTPWLRDEDGRDESPRIRRMREKAEAEKRKDVVLGDEFEDEVDDVGQRFYRDNHHAVQPPGKAMPMGMEIISVPSSPNRANGEYNVDALFDPEEDADYEDDIQPPRNRDDDLDSLFESPARSEDEQSDHGMQAAASRRSSTGSTIEVLRPQDVQDDPMDVDAEGESEDKAPSKTEVEVQVIEDDSDDFEPPVPSFSSDDEEYAVVDDNYNVIYTARMDTAAPSGNESLEQEDEEEEEEEEEVDEYENAKLLALRIAQEEEAAEKGVGLSPAMGTPVTGSQEPAEVEFLSMKERRARMGKGTRIVSRGR